MIKFLSPAYEPVRAWLYGVAVAGIAIAVLLNWLSAAEGAAVATFVGAILMVPLAELVRTKTAAWKQTGAVKDKATGQLKAGPAATGSTPVGTEVETLRAEPF